jgi:hypothetical protein
MRKQKKLWRKPDSVPDHSSQILHALRIWTNDPWWEFSILVPELWSCSECPYLLMIPTQLYCTNFGRAVMNLKQEKPPKENNLWSHVVGVRLRFAGHLWKMNCVPPPIQFIVSTGTCILHLIQLNSLQKRNQKELSSGWENWLVFKIAD